MAQFDSKAIFSFLYWLNLIKNFSIRYKFKKNLKILIAGDIGACISGMILLGRNNNGLYWYIPMSSNIFKNKLSKFLYYLKAKLPRKIITISPYQVENLKAICKNASVTLCGNFLSIKDIARLEKVKSLRSKNIRNGTTTLAVIGRFHPQKGQDLAINAVRDYCQFNSKIKLLLIGGSADELKSRFPDINLDNLNLIIENWSDNPFEFGFDALIMPSRYEGNPIVLHEARYLGIPVFCSKIKQFEMILKPKEIIKKWDLEAISDICISLNRKENKLENISDNSWEVGKSQWMRIPEIVVQMQL